MSSQFQFKEECEGQIKWYRHRIQKLRRLGLLTEIADSYEREMSMLITLLPSLPAAPQQLELLSGKGGGG